MRFALLLLITLQVFTSCNKDDLGQPEKDQPTFVEGLIEGKYSDGDPLEESFRFENGYSTEERFIETSNGLQLQLLRRQGSNYIKLNVAFKDIGLPTEDLVYLNDHSSSANEFSFYYLKETSNTSLAEISAKGFQSSKAFRSLSIEENTRYNLIVDKYNRPIIASDTSYYEYPDLGGEPYQVKITEFTNTTGDTVAFSHAGHFASPLSFKEIKYADGTLSTSDNLYSELQYDSEGTIYAISPTFLRISSAGASTALYEEFEILDGFGTIKEYNYDLTTARLTFSFEINIDDSNNTNSTKNDLFISGKFDSGPNKVYLETTN